MRRPVTLTPLILLLQNVLPPVAAQERTLRFVILVHGMRVIPVGGSRMSLGSLGKEGGVVLLHTKRTRSLSSLCV